MRPELLKPICGRCGSSCDEGWIPAPEMDPQRLCVDCALERQAPEATATRAGAAILVLIALGVSGVPIAALIEWLSALAPVDASRTDGSRDLWGCPEPPELSDLWTVVLIWIVFVPFSVLIWRSALGLIQLDNREAGRVLRLAARRRRPGTIAIAAVQDRPDVAHAGHSRLRKSGKCAKLLRVNSRSGAAPETRSP